MNLGEFRHKIRHYKDDTELVVSSIRGRHDIDIYGVIEDKAYWQLCTEEIAKLPSNIHVKYFGEVHPTLVPKTFSAYEVSQNRRHHPRARQRCNMLGDERHILHAQHIVAFNV